MWFQLKVHMSSLGFLWTFSVSNQDHDLSLTLVLATRTYIIRLSWLCQISKTHLFNFISCPFSHCTVSDDGSFTGYLKKSEWALKLWRYCDHDYCINSWFLSVMIVFRLQTEWLQSLITSSNIYFGNFFFLFIFNCKLDMFLLVWSGITFRGLAVCGFSKAAQFFFSKFPLIKKRTVFRLMIKKNKNKQNSLCRGSGSSRLPAYKTGCPGQ